MFGPENLNVEDGARPDLAGVDQDGMNCVLIKAKFWAVSTLDDLRRALPPLGKETARNSLSPVGTAESRLTCRSGSSQVLDAVVVCLEV